MENRYASSLRKIEMSEERKKTLADTLAREIESVQSRPHATVAAQRPRKLKGHRPARFKIAVAAACIAAVVGGAGAAYAADLGGIQRIVQVWVHGDQTEATFVVDNGTYTLDYVDANGNAVHRGGGGVVVNPDGTERPATEEELLEEVNAPDVAYEEDGRVIVYCNDQALDITDKFEDGVCYVQLQIGEKAEYMTIKYQNGYALSPNGYVQPDMFNTGE